MFSQVSSSKVRQALAACVRKNTLLLMKLFLSHWSNKIAVLSIPPMLALFILFAYFTLFIVFSGLIINFGGPNYSLTIS